MKLHLMLISSLVLTSTLYSQAIDDEELRLMYDSFIFSKDLPHAYDVAKKAMKNAPNSLYWHKKMGEVALWTGHNDEAMEHLIYVYQKTSDQKLGDSIIKQMLATYQYQKAQPLIQEKVQHSYDSVDAMIDINNKTGQPQESIKALKALYLEKPDTKYLSAMLAIYLETGEVQAANDVVQSLQQHPDISVKAALALSKYYFLKQKLNKAYRVLLKVKSKAQKDDIPYFQQLSDLGWNVHDYNNAVYGSMMLYHAKKARMVDYERIQQQYKSKDINLMRKIAMQAMKKHQSKKFLLSYADEAMKKGHYDSLKTLLDTKLNNKRSKKLLKDDPEYWLMKSKLDSHYNDTENSQADLQKALALASASSDTASVLLWSMIDNAQYSALEELITKITSKSPISPQNYHALAAGYLALQKPDKAMVYLHKKLDSTPEDMELRFLHAEILGAQGDVAGKNSVLKEILNTLTEEGDMDNTRFRNPQFLRRYLQASFPFTSQSSFETLLESYKGALAKKDYQELKILHALKHKQYKKAQTLAQNLSHKDPQLAIELAHQLHRDKEERILLSQYPFIAPKSLLIEKAQAESRYTDAIRLSKEAILDNASNPYLAQKLQQLYTHHSSHYGVNAGYSTRGDLKMTTISLYNFYHIKNEYGIYTKLKRDSYSSSDKKRLNINSEHDLFLHAGVQTALKDGLFQTGITYRSAQKSGFGVLLKAEKTLNDTVQIAGRLQTNKNVKDQSVYMQIAGKQDQFNLQATYAFSEQQRLTLSGEYNRYQSQDGFKIGTGTRENIAWDYTLFPLSNTGVRLFYNMGSFDETGDKGNISQILRAEQSQEKLLQNNYKDIGLGVYYGDNEKKFGIAMKPYVDFAAIYSTKDKRFYTAIDAGIQHATSEKNAYHLGVHYQNALNGLEQNEFGLTLGYTSRY